MTTLVALPTKDAVVMGCDSLATVSKPLVDPLTILDEYFDSESGDLKVDESGKPVLAHISDLFDKAESVPFDHMTHVDKLFHFKPLRIGVMFAGITAIGNRTIKGLLSEFRSTDKAFEEGATNYTVRSIAERLLNYLTKHYEKEFEDFPTQAKPALDVILAGYGISDTKPPAVVKLDVAYNELNEEPQFWPVFGGQSREIQRIVYGFDWESYVRIEERHALLMKSFAEETLKANGIEEEASVPELGRQYRIFTPDLDLPGVRANWGDFSEQNAIDCVGYFIRIMSEAQRFSARMPTVGGEIHVALIDRESGFRFISRREYSYEGHRVQRAT